MSVSLLKNIFSARAQYGLSQATDALTRNFERLSSGSRINRPSDDSAGQAVAAGLSRDTRVYGRAILNLNDGVSALSIADASLGQLSDVTTRLKELATQSANGSLSRVQRNSLDDEADQLVEEFNRLVATTRFNGIGLLDGSTQNMRLQAGYGTNGGLAFGLVDKLSRVTGSGSFSEGTTHTSGSGGQNDAVYEDFDGDGVLDRISVGTGGGGIRNAVLQGQR